MSLFPYIPFPLLYPRWMTLQWSRNDKGNGTNLLPAILVELLLVPGEHLLLGVKAAHEQLQGAPSLLQAGRVGFQVAPQPQRHLTILLARWAAMQCCQLSWPLPSPIFILHSFKLSGKTPESLKYFVSVYYRQYQETPKTKAIKIETPMSFQNFTGMLNRGLQSQMPMPKLRSSILFEMAKQ